MQYGFVIDHDNCIGCHACTVACKSENNVPVGDFRTSVKYTEVGVYPDIVRNFLVQRCNQCSDPPCATICPVGALTKREDGIVDLDRDACVGCKACMQACPYDSIYLNEDLGAAEKCHFCAHRVEQGLEPACVVVCPTNALIPGDFDDEESPVSKILREHKTTVRRPEQGTNPNVHYINADPVAMRPGAAARPSTYIWSDRPDDKPDQWPLNLKIEKNARTVLDSPHHMHWGWHVSAYLVTKGIAAGAAILAPFASQLGLSNTANKWLPETLAIIFLAITCLLLVADLARPMMFFRLLTRPNMKSWLVKGGMLLGLFGITSLAALIVSIAGQDSILGPLRWINAALGLGVAGYTAFLFKQCKGRDLWESSWLLPHLLAQAVMCGGVFYALFGADTNAVKLVVTIGVLMHALFVAIEVLRHHATDNATQAAAFLKTLRVGPLRGLRDSLIIGVAVAIAAMWLVPVVAVIPLLVGLALYEHIFVRAGQLPPLS